jgi:two-component sensor histidine kinase
LTKQLRVVPQRAAGRSGDFFAQARELIEEGADAGDITAEQAKALGLLFGRIEEQSAKMQIASTWEQTQLRRSLAANEHAPRSARDVVSFVGSGIPEETLEIARLLTSELVSNSVRHGPTGPKAVIDLMVEVGRKDLRVEVSDRSAGGARPRPPDENGGWGLNLVDTLASRWGTRRSGELNVTWFEVDLPQPGS